MSATLQNIFVNVPTFHESMLAAQTNYGCFAATFNKKFDNFQNLTANLGDTVRISLPYRWVSGEGLVVNGIQPTTQRYLDIVVDKSRHLPLDISAQQWLFNAEQFMDTIGSDAVAEMGTYIEADLGKECEVAPYRFYGNGIDPINQYNQLGKMLAQFRDFGMPNTNLDAYLLSTAIPDLVATGLTQYVPSRNEEIANKWMVSDFDSTRWMRTNLLPRHVAGTVGQAQTVLTVVSVTRNSAGGVITMTLSGAPTSDVNAMKAYDKGQFQHVDGLPDVRFRTYVGHIATSLPVQFNVLADAESTIGGEVTISIDPPLQSAVGQDQNVTTDIIAGMKVKFLPTCRMGMIVANKAAFCAMPMLPEVIGFPTSSRKDDTTGVATRFYAGDLIGQNQQLRVYDAIWARKTASSYVMGVIFPD